MTPLGHQRWSRCGAAWHLQLTCDTWCPLRPGARAGRNRYLAAFYERLLDQGRRMLHLHFDYLERSTEGQLLTGEHEEMLQAIRDRDRDVARADALAHAHRRQFRDQFLECLRVSCSGGMGLARGRAGTTVGLSSTGW